MLWTFVLVLAAAGSAPVAAVLLRRADAPIPVAVAAGLAALGTGLVCWRWSAGAWPGRWLPVPCLLTAFAVPLALADLRHLRLPDVLTLPAYPAFATALALTGPAPAVRAVAGAALFGGVHLLIHLRAPDSLGAGDVKLAAPLGAVLAASGWAALPAAAVLAALFTTALACARRRHGVPHGPSLLLATWLCALFPPSP